MVGYSSTPLAGKLGVKEGSCLADNKVCAVTDIGSGLRFVGRKENRA